MNNRWVMIVLCMTSPASYAAENNKSGIVAAPTDISEQSQHTLQSGGTVQCMRRILTCDGFPLLKSAGPLEQQSVHRSEHKVASCLSPHLYND